MTILNVNSFSSEKYKPYIDDNKNYWFIYVPHAHLLKDIFQSIPIDILNKIKYGDVHLLISNEFECFEDVPYEVYVTIVIEHGVNENKITYLSGAKNIEEIVANICCDINEKHKTQYKPYTSFLCRWYEYDLSKLYKNSTNNFLFKRSLALNGNINYTKHYLFLNNRWRPHRPTLVALLQSKNILQHGYVSLGKNDINQTWSSIWETILNLNKDNKEICTLLESNKQRIFDIPDLVLDTNNYDLKNATIDPNLNKYYENSFMSIVSETYFYDFKTIFFSEKIFKPVVYKQPFILLGVPHCLEFFRELGYKSFHPFINESYDSIENNSLRMQHIANEIERICKLSQKELKELSMDLRDNCSHNFKLLMSKSK